MKVFHVSQSDARGGAARSAYRLHEAMRGREGVESKFICAIRDSDIADVVAPNSWQSRLSQLVLQKLDRTLVAVSSQAGYSRDFSTTLGTRFALRHIKKHRPDVVHVHWTGFGSFALRSLRDINCPIVWTLHDMWPITGGCHYTGGCVGFKTKCGCCPALGSQRSRDLSSFFWHSKRSIFRDLDLQLVTPSNWLATQVRQSALLGHAKVAVILYGINLSVFKPLDKRWARSLFNIDGSKRIILFGADGGSRDPRKGFELLQNAMRLIAQDVRTRAEVEVIVFGGQPLGAINLDGVVYHHIGRIRDDYSLAALYSAADVFVLPSREDNSPNTVIEALSCGLPCVGYSVGGVGELILHNKTGWLVPSVDAESLYEVLRTVTQASAETLTAMADAARRYAEASFSSGQQAQRYRELYTAHINGSHR